MKKNILILSLMLPWAGSALEAAPWLTDLPMAQAQAKREGKTVLLDFTGSDWCGWCIKLKNEIFSKPEFEAFASRHLVLVEVDFPRRSPLPPAAQKANQELAQRFGVQGFPTLVYLNSDGKEVGRGGYQEGGAKAWVQNMARALKISYDPSAPAPPPASALYGGAAVVPPPEYKDLVLKGISGSKNRPFALINNQTLALGESARIRMGNANVRVRCVEIRKRSVLVTINGEEPARELFLDGS